MGALNNVYDRKKKPTLGGCVSEELRSMETGRVFIKGTKKRWYTRSISLSVVNGQDAESQLGSV